MVYADASLTGLWIALAAIGGVILGAGIFFLFLFLKSRHQVRKANKIIRDAEIKAEHIAKNAQLDAKRAVQEAENRADRDIKERKQEVANLENKLFQREQNIDRRDSQLTQKEAAIDEKNEKLDRRLKDCDRKEAQLQEKIDSIIVELEKVAKMSTQEARDQLCPSPSNLPRALLNVNY